MGYGSRAIDLLTRYYEGGLFSGTGGDEEEEEESEDEEASSEDEESEEESEESSAEDAEGGEFGVGIADDFFRLSV